MLSKSQVEESLRDTDGDEYDFNDDVVSINAVLEGSSSAMIGHFVVASEYRRQGYGSVVFEVLLDVLASEGVSIVVVEIQALDDGSESDPVMDFLERYGFTEV